MSSSVEITCLCGRTQETVCLQGKIPLQTTLCHCNSCRHANGTLCAPSLPLARVPGCVQSLQRYGVSANKSRLFCSFCGTNICYHLQSTDTWYLRSGVVERTLENEQVSDELEEIVEHQFVADTLDGGLAPCFTGTNKTQARSYLQSPKSYPASSSPEPLSTSAKRPSLRAACHCGGVQFLVSRPDESSRKCSSPFPDLTRPYHMYSSENVHDEKWWIRGSDKYLAGTCACRTCRLAFASPITCWAFIPKANLSRLDGAMFDFDFGTLATYESSQNTYRNFCKNCGTPIFWHNKERPELIDVSVGVLRAEEGARAETWLEWWTERVSFAEDAFEKSLVADFLSKLHMIKVEI